MRCDSCDVNLTDFESSIRSSNTGQYLNMCNRCLSYIREALQTSENFLLYDPNVDDLNTQFAGVDDMAFSELFEDDSAAGVTADGERIADYGGRFED